MGPSRGAVALAVLLGAAVMLPAAVPAAPAPVVTARTDRSPEPGENFTLTFTLTSLQTANYTILVSPKPEFSFADLSNGSRRLPVENGTAVDFEFQIRVSPSARPGTYVLSYSVLREDATVKMGTVEVKVGSPGPCTSLIALLPATGLLAALACAWRPGR